MFGMFQKFRCIFLSSLISFYRVINGLARHFGTALSAFGHHRTDCRPALSVFGPHRIRGMAEQSKQRPGRRGPRNAEPEPAPLRVSLALVSTSAREPASSIGKAGKKQKTEVKEARVFHTTWFLAVTQPAVWESHNVAWPWIMPGA